MSAHIQFECPTCKEKLSAPIDQAGSKINCSNCGQRLQIPPPDRTKTVLAAGLGVSDDPTPSRSAMAAKPQPAESQPARSRDSARNKGEKVYFDDGEVRITKTR